MPLFQEPNQLNQSDNRYFPRWEVDKRTVYQLTHDLDEKDARIVDLSCAGACVISEDPLLPTQRVKLNIFLNDATVVSISGRVVWVKHIPSRNEAGVSFDDIDEKAQELILAQAFNLKKNDLVNYWFKGWDGEKT